MFNSMRILILFICSIVYSNEYSNIDSQNSIEINVIEQKGKLSEVANNCISGLVHHHEGLSPLLASTVNSYDRLQPASMAGYWANWAGDHRMVTIRTSTTSSNSARIEHRTADGAGNPYIVTSLIFVFLVFDPPVISLIGRSFRFYCPFVLLPVAYLLCHLLNHL